VAIKECFACEKQYEYSDSFYCSAACQAEFGAILLTEIEESKSAGLVSDEGIALPLGNSLSDVQVKSIMEQFRLKVKIP